MRLDIVGIDPSIAATGIATRDGALMVVKDSKVKGDDRLPLLRQTVERICYGVDLVVMEDLPRNAMAAGVTGMAQGVVRAQLRELGVPYLLVTPATLKKAACNVGNAKKGVMVKAWQDATGLDTKDDNMVDAGFLREIGQYLTGQPHILANTECVDDKLLDPFAALAKAGIA